MSEILGSGGGIFDQTGTGDNALDGRELELLRKLTAPENLLRAHPEFVSWIMDQFTLRGFEVPLSQVQGFFSTSAQIIIETQELESAGTFDFTNIPDRYNHLRLMIYSRSSRAIALDTVFMRLNGDTGSNYYSQVVRGIGATASAGEDLGNSALVAGISTGSSATANLYGTSEVVIPFYKNTTNKKSFATQWGVFSGTGSGAGHAGAGGGFWDSSSAINRIQLVSGLFGNFEPGSIATLYAHN